MLEQTRYAVNCLKSLGLRRNQFSCTTERHYIGKHPETGRAMYEYGQVNIYLKFRVQNPVDFAIESAKAGLYPTLAKAGVDGKRLVHIHLNSHRLGKKTITLLDSTRKNEWGGCCVEHFSIEEFEQFKEQI